MNYWKKIIKNGIYDAHLHLNLKASSPEEDFNKLRDKYNIKGGILVLNTREEKEIFSLGYYKLELSNFLIAFSIRKGDEKEELDFKSFLEKKGYKVALKVHPRLSQITKADFSLLKDKISRLETKLIIIDGFYYGSALESHINLELLIYLAKAFPHKKFIFAHSGGHRVLETMLYTADLNNIYYDLSLSLSYLKKTSVFFDYINFIIRRYKKIIFGSDYPEFEYIDILNDFYFYLEQANMIDTMSDISIFNFEKLLRMI